MLSFIQILLFFLTFTLIEQTEILINKEGDELITSSLSKDLFIQNNNLLEKVRYRRNAKPILDQLDW
ncbi:hypothetical protein Mgra_00010075 [Meloidogyne graminicola]|uniref:Uncharacterized protein n=1 Tax=Meloidogyne graminicola TaxID=189291 RepID=A0A8S9ZAA3_9BILA|nr:hypothetical protein Mgra_00010075 [Meloidogyne graminicola]